MVNNVLKYIITSVVVTLVISLVASYAYFAISITSVKDNVDINAVFNSVPIVSFSSSAPASMDISVDDMLEENGSNSYTKYKSGTATLTAKIENPTENIRTNCTYSIVYNPIIPYAASQNTYIEYSLSGQAAVVNGTASPMTISELNLSGITEETTILNNATFNVQGANETSTLVWTFTFKYYNLGVNQSINMGNQISGELQFKNINCTLAAN